MTNPDDKFSFEKYLAERGYKRHERNKFAKGYISMRYIGGGKRLMILNHNPTYKHKHIATCLMPHTHTDANTMFKLFEIE